ncbi:unnamed protein product [Rotaria magnacalcarata]
MMMHHNRTIHSSLEFNDMFSFLFASIAIGLIFIDYSTSSAIYLSVGLGITLYGFIYFIIHDGLIHQRYAFWNKTSNSYLKQMQRAHQRHHMRPHKQPSEEYGLFLLISGKYWHDVFFS